MVSINLINNKETILKAVLNDKKYKNWIKDNSIKVLIIDKYKNIVQELTKGELEEFIDGSFTIQDGDGNTWHYPSLDRHKKPSNIMLMNFLNKIK